MNDHDALSDIFSEIEKSEGMSDEERAEIKEFLKQGPDALPEHLVKEPPAAVPIKAAPQPEEDKERADIRILLADATIPQKIKYAMFGNGVCRTILINDPNRIVQTVVLRNPRITQAEVEDFARDRNKDDYVLRAIADNKAFMKSYKVKLNLVMNPKTPGDVSLKWLRHLNEGDLRRIAKSREVPQLVSVTARKRVSEGSKGKS